MKVFAQYFQIDALPLKPSNIRSEKKLAYKKIGSPLWEIDEKIERKSRESGQRGERKTRT